MQILDAGHRYLLNSLDGGHPIDLTFVKRSGPKFPFNANSNPGTNVQEVLRALIDRTAYLNRQNACAETEAAEGCLRAALALYEMRAARRHGRHLDLMTTDQLCSLPVCAKCGHIGCEGRHE